ncbi:MAG: hypothetical protein ABL890_02555 [Candidatus Peribacteraceae bacterium]
MPTLTVSWDLTIVVFFAIVMSYSFIIGKEQSVNIIIASYISAVAVQGIGNVLTKLVGTWDIFLTSIGMQGDTTILPVAKIFLFALCVIVIVQRSGIGITFAKEGGKILNIAATALFGYASAGLIVSILLTYATGSAILDSGMLSSAPLIPLLQQSTLMQIMLLNQDLWYTLPAFLIIVMGFLHMDDE